MDFIIVSIVVGLAIPWVTEFITKASAPLWVRSTLNLALSALAGVLTTVSLDDYASWQTYFYAIFVAWLATMRAHYAGFANPVARATPDIGIGEPTTKT